MSLGERLAELRKSAGFTQFQLGEQLNLSAQAISKWENNLAEPDLETLRKLSSIYNIPLAELLEGDAGARGNTAPEGDSAVAYKLVFSGLNGTRSKIMAIKGLMDLTGCELAPAKKIVEGGGVILYGSEQECLSLAGRLDNEGISTSCEPCYENTAIGVCTRCGVHVTVSNAGLMTGFTVTCKDCQDSARAVSRLKRTAESEGVKKLFVIANITAAVPAVIWVVLGIIIGFGSNILLDLALMLAGAYVAYAFVFQLWYKTPVRWVSTRPAAWLRAFRRFCFEDTGFFFAFALLLYLFGAIALAVVALMGIAIGAVMAPFLYPSVIKARLENLRSGSTDDIEVMDDIVA